MKQDPISINRKIFLFSNTLTNTSKENIQTISSFCDTIWISKNQLENLKTIGIADPQYITNSQTGQLEIENPWDSPDIKSTKPKNFTDSQKAQLEEWEEREDTKKLTHQVLTKLEANINQLALQWKIWYNIANFYLKNEFGYTDKKDINQTSTHQTHNTNLNLSGNFDPKEFEHVEKLLTKNGFRGFVEYD